MIPSFQEKMVKTWQQAKGPDPVERRNPSGSIPEKLWPVVGGTNPTPRRISLGLKSRVNIITDLEKGKNSNPLSYPPARSWPMEHQGNPQEKSPTSVDVGGGMTQEMCIPILWWTRIKLEALRTWQTNIPMTIGVQWIGNRSMAACTQYSGGDLDTKAIHPSQRKMIKRHRMGIRSMVLGTWHVDFGPRARTTFI